MAHMVHGNEGNGWNERTCKWHIWSLVWCYRVKGKENGFMAFYDDDKTTTNFLPDSRGVGIGQTEGWMGH
jgi:hypothetical protein